MILFTPNTIIKSADINTNFDSLDTRTEVLETSSCLVSAYRHSGAGVTVTGATVLVCTIADINVGSCYGANSTGVFTAPKAGKYFVNFTTFKNADTSFGNLGLRKNGSEIQRTYTSAMGGSYYVPIALTYVVTLATNDTLDIYVGAGLVIHGAGSSQLVINYLGT